MSPVGKNSWLLPFFPYSSSQSRQRLIDSLAQTTHDSLLPYELRTPRVSSPDVDREFPAPYRSTIVTRAPMRLRLSAVHAPKLPPPTTTMSGAALRIAGLPEAGCSTSARAGSERRTPACLRKSRRSTAMPDVRGRQRVWARGRTASEAAGVAGAV